MSKCKCYLFFIKYEEYRKLVSFNINNDNHDLDHILYAYTFNKADAKEFQESRNMTKFKLIKKNVEVEDILELEHKYIMCELVVISEKDPASNISLLVTKDEFISLRTIFQKKIVALNFDIEYYDKKIFNNKIKKALSSLKYKELLSNSQDMLINKKIKTDYLSMFVELFKPLMKGF